MIYFGKMPESEFKADCIMVSFFVVKLTSACPARVEFCMMRSLCNSPAGGFSSRIIGAEK